MGLLCFLKTYKKKVGTYLYRSLSHSEVGCKYKKVLN